MVVTISPSFSLERIVVFPAASSPTMRMRTSFLPKSFPKTLEKVRPCKAKGIFVGGHRISMVNISTKGVVQHAWIGRESRRARGSHHFGERGRCAIFSFSH